MNSPLFFYPFQSSNKVQWDSFIPPSRNPKPSPLIHPIWLHLSSISSPHPFRQLNLHFHHDQIISSRCLSYCSYCRTCVCRVRCHEHRLWEYYPNHRRCRLPPPRRWLLHVCHDHGAICYGLARNFSDPHQRLFRHPGQHLQNPRMVCAAWVWNSLYDQGQLSAGRVDRRHGIFRRRQPILRVYVRQWEILHW